MADFTVLRGPSDPLPIKYADMGDGTAAEVVAIGSGGGGGAGDASAANQTRVQAVIGAATAPTHMNVSGGVYNSTPLTLTDGQSCAFQFDSSGFLKISGALTGLAQGSTTSGQTGSLQMGAVTTAAPSYTTAQTSPLSLTTGGSLRTEVMASALPSGAATAANQATTNTNITNLTGTKAAGTAAANSLLAGGVYNSTPPTLTNGQQCALQFTSAGKLMTDATFTGGDASATNQTAVQGVIGAATAPTKMEVGGGVYNSTPLTLTNGQSSALQLDANGYLKVNVVTATGVAIGSTTSGQTISPVGGAVTTAAPTYTTAQTHPLSLQTDGSVRVANTAAIPAGTALIGYVGHGKTIKSVGFSLTADGDLVALVSSKRIKVIAYYFSKAGTTASIYNIRTNNASGTILAKIQLQAQTGGVYAANLAIAAPSFLFASAAGEALYLDVPDAEAVTGFITYFDDDAT